MEAGTLTSDWIELLLPLLLDLLNIKERSNIAARPFQDNLGNVSLT